MSEIKIEKNIPMPADKSNRKGAPAKYPYKSMAVGDSFFVAEEKGKSKGYMLANILRATASGWVKRNGNGEQFSVRQVDGGVRVWRIK